LDLSLSLQGTIEVIDCWQDFPARLRGGCVTVGNFDGVHRGHQVLLRHAARWAEAAGRPSVVLTFDPHPLAILQPEHAPPALTTLPDRARRLADCGIDVMVVCRVDQTLLDWDYRQFFQRVLVQTLAANKVVEGPNFFFGKDRQGDVQKLQELCLQHRIESQIVVPEEIGGRMISSSRIRHWLRAGDIEQANSALGAPYRVSGQIVPGDGRGRTLGFPTANLDGIETILPKEGVYMATTRFEGRLYDVALHIGAPLTFGNLPSRAEAHLLDFHQDVYGRWFSFDVQRRLRDIQRYESVEALRCQIEADLQAVRAWSSADNARRLAGGGSSRRIGGESVGL
jgi:riboflavin kinase/FMN adenylyltransferase